MGYRRLLVRHILPPYVVVLVTAELITFWAVLKLVMAIDWVVHHWPICHTQVALCRAGLQVMMATGDYHSTALAVARDVGMIAPGGQVFIIQKGTEAKPARLGFLTSAMRSDKPGQQGHSVGGFRRSVSFAEQGQYSGSEHQGQLFLGSASHSSCLTAS